MFSCFGLYSRIQELIVLLRFASTLDFFQYVFKDIVSRAISSDVSVHFFHKSLCTIFTQLDVLDKFYKIHVFSKFMFAPLFLLCNFFLVMYSYFRDCVHLHDFILEKNT